MSQKILIAITLAVVSLSACVIPIPLPTDTITSDCTQVNARSADIQSLLRDTLRECANDLRVANPSCARVDKMSDLNGYYAYASDECVAKGETSGFPNRAEYSMERKEVAALSQRIRRKLN